MTMRHLFLVFQNETDHTTYNYKTFIKSFDSQAVAEEVVEKLQKEFGYFTRFNEEKTFSFEEMFANTSDSILDVIREIEENIR